MSLHRLVMTVAVAGGLALGATLGHAGANGGLGIDGVDVEQVAALGAGVPLRFSVYGSPQAIATLRIEGGWRVLALQETSPGVYEGTYVIDARDAVGPGSRVTATLQQRGEVARADLDEPLLLAAAPLPWADAAVTAGGRASPSLPTSPSVSPLPSVSPSPLPSPSAPPRSEPVPAAPPTALAVPAAAPPQVVARGPARVTCDDCARVESVRTVDAPSREPVAKLPDTIARAVLGDELGQAHTQRMRRLFDTVTGRDSARSASAPAEYEVVLRTSDGRRLVRRYEQPPPFAPGATIRLGRGEPAPF